MPFKHVLKPHGTTKGKHTNPHIKSPPHPQGPARPLNLVLPCWVPGFPGPGPQQMKGSVLTVTGEKCRQFSKKAREGTEKEVQETNATKPEIPGGSMTQSHKHVNRRRGSVALPQ